MKFNKQLNQIEYQLKISFADFCPIGKLNFFTSKNLFIFHLLMENFLFKIEFAFKEALI